MKQQSKQPSLTPSADPERGAKLRIAVRCRGARGVRAIAFYENTLLSFSDRTAQQIFVPLLVRNSNFDSSPIGKGIANQLGLVCCDCKDESDDYPKYYPRSLNVDADGFNRFGPVQPYMK